MLELLHQSNSTLLHHVSFPRKQPAFYHIFQMHFPTPPKKSSHKTKWDWWWTFHATATVDLTQVHVNSLKTTCISSCISHTQGKGQIGNNQSRSPLWIIFLFSCLTYPNLFKVMIYLWLGSIGNTTEFQFAFCHKIRWNSIFWTTNCR